MNKRVLYPTGMVWIILLCLALAILAAGMDSLYPDFAASELKAGASAGRSGAPLGIALPSPNQWNFLPIWGEAINIGAFGLCALSLYLLNKQYSLIRTGQPLGAAFFLPLYCANPTISAHLTAAPIVGLLCILIFDALFHAYRQRNATKSMFFVATCLAVGSMIEYAMIPFIVAACIGAAIMGVMRIKEFLAIGLGLVAPYWVVIGLGIINPMSLNIPHPATIFTTTPDARTFLLLGIASVLALAGAILSLYNGMILYAGNTRVRRSILTVNTFGVTAFAAMWLDLANISAYLGVFYLWIALQLANFFTLRELQRGMLTFWFIQLIIISSFLLFVLVI